MFKKKTDSSSDDGDGKFNFERLESAESLEESLKEIDLSEETGEYFVLIQFLFYCIIRCPIFYQHSYLQGTYYFQVVSIRSSFSKYLIH